jgi:hypothetical protein
MRGREFAELARRHVMPHLSGFKEAMMADIRALMLQTGVPVLERRATVEDIARQLARQPDRRTDPHVAEALTYSLILIGDYGRARKHLGLLRQITLADEERARWWRELNAGTADEGEEDWGSRSANARHRLKRRSTAHQRGRSLS